VAPNATGDNALWNTIFGDPSDHHFWRSDASFWFGTELPKPPKTPRMLAEVRKQEEQQEELRGAIALRRKTGPKREN
jgi:hypothetical protein